MAEERPGRRDKKRQARREAILGIAKSCFVEFGYGDTTMSMVASMCGGSKSTLWTYFPSKEALFSAVVDHMVGDFGKAMEEALVGDRSPRHSLRSFGLVYLAKVTSEDAGILRRILAADGHRFPPLVKAFYGSGPGLVRSRLTKYMEDSMEQGVIRAGDPEQAARQFISLCQAGCFWDILWYRPGGPGSSLAKDVDGAVETFLRAWTECPASL